MGRDGADSSPSKGSSNNAAAAVFKRIFKPKMMGSRNKDTVRKGQVEIEVKTKSSALDDEDEIRLLKTKRAPSPPASPSMSRGVNLEPTVKPRDAAIAEVDSPSVPEDARRMPENKTEDDALNDHE